MSKTHFFLKLSAGGLTAPTALLGVGLMPGAAAAGHHVVLVLQLVRGYVVFPGPHM